MICLKCGRKLKNVVSQQAGYGPVCYRRMFGTSLRDGRKDGAAGLDDVFCYDILGQITIEEYLQTISG